MVDVCEKILTIQRDYGNRRPKNARFKYTVDRLGLERVKTELNQRLDGKFKNQKPLNLSITVIVLVDSRRTQLNFTLFIQNGRIKDLEDYKLKTAL